MGQQLYKALGIQWQMLPSPYHKEPVDKDVQFPLQSEGLKLIHWTHMYLSAH